MIEMMKSI